jgi:FlaA1/EpsC-like NDP-sugar epimerase
MIADFSDVVFYRSINRIRKKELAMKVSNKVIVVTGGGNGIGQELVLNLLNKGAKVAAVDISEAGLQQTVVRTL